MGEYVWTSISVGGKATRKVWDELFEMCDEWAEQGDDLDRFASGADTGYATFQGMRNYGNADEVDEFCRDHGLTYLRHWGGAGGVFNSGAEFYSPSGGVKQIETNDDGEPVAPLGWLERKMKDGASLGDITAELLAASIHAVPALEIVAEAPQAESAEG